MDGLRTIYKYTLRADGGQQILHMPAGSVIKKAGFQNGQVCLWALVNTDQKRMVRGVYEIFGTGFYIPPGPTYVDTVFEDGFVWHIFKWED